jgi:hypothetical protein
MKLTTFFTLAFVAVCLSVSSQDKKATPLKYQIGLSYSINKSNNPTFDTKYNPDSDVDQFSNLFTDSIPFLNTVSVNFSRSLNYYTNISAGVSYTECTIVEIRQQLTQYGNSSIFKSKSINRNFVFVDVPIIWTFTLKNSKKETLNFRALVGVFPSFTIKSTGHVYNFESMSDNKYGTGSSSSNNFLDPKYNYSPVLLCFDLGLKLEYNIFKKFSLNFQTIYRNRGNVKFDERYASLMLDFGVGYRF